MQTQDGQFLLGELVRRNFAILAVKDKGIGAVPVLNDIYPFMDLPSQWLRRQILTEKNGFDRSPQFGEGLIRGMLDIVAGKPAQDGLRLCRAYVEGHGKLDHLIILLTNEFPVDRSRQNRRQRGIGIRGTRTGPIELLSSNIFQARHQVEAQEIAKRKSDRTLSMGIHILL